MPPSLSFGSRDVASTWLILGSLVKNVIYNWIKFHYECRYFSEIAEYLCSGIISFNENTLCINIPLEFLPFMMLLVIVNLTILIQIFLWDGGSTATIIMNIDAINGCVK